MNDTSRSYLVFISAYILILLGMTVEDVVHGAHLRYVIFEGHHHIPPLLIGLFFSISSRRFLSKLSRSENQKKDLLKKYKNLYEGSPLPYHSLSPDGNFVEVNPAWLNLLGYSRDEVIGKSYGEFLHPQWLETFKSKFPVFLKTGSVKDVHFKIRHKDGNYLDISLGGCLNYDDTGSVQNTNCVFVDITEREKLFEEQTRSAQLAALGTVAAGVAHEINNPIQGIINYATILQQKPRDFDFVSEISKRISEEGFRIASLTQNLLGFCREDGEQKIETDIRLLIEKSVQILDKKTKKHGVNIEINCKEGMPRVEVFPNAIQQVIINLVDNSFYATMKKEGCLDDKIVKIFCSLSEENGKKNLCFEVYDRGIGMSTDVIAKAKQAFYSTKPSSEGSGLGLAIVNSIVRKHQGTMTIESKEGEETTVRIYLPVDNDVE